MSSADTDSDHNSSDEELREAFAKGLLKPGLNAVIEEQKKTHKNCVGLMKSKLAEIKLDLPWIERLDLVNAPAPLAPEMALEIQEQEIRRAKQLAGNRKLPQFESSMDPVLNDLRRETTFQRQAQGAVLDGMARLKKLGVFLMRPDDYFAEMAKSDAHMQKVRENLMKKQVVAERSERIRQLRQQKKVAKQMQVETMLKKHAEKRKFMEDVKKYRKGIKKDLDFLENKKKPTSAKSKPPNTKVNRKAQAKKKMKNLKYGFGGKKRGSKKNTKASSANVEEYRSPGRPRIKKSGGKAPGGKAPGGKASGGRAPGGNVRGGKNKRLGKSRRLQMKGKKRGN